MALTAAKGAEEVERLHAFFVEWFTAAVPKTEDTYQSRFAKMLHPSFQMVQPSGTLVARDQLLQDLDKAHGSSKSFSIEIRNCKVVLESSDTLLMTYEEWQTVGAETTALISTVAFVPNGDDAARGLQWFHIHETWMPGMGPKDEVKSYPVMNNV